jgi:hypothetical protein
MFSNIFFVRWLTVGGSGNHMEPFAPPMWVAAQWCRLAHNDWSPLSLIEFRMPGTADVAACQAATTTNTLSRSLE